MGNTILMEWITPTHRIGKTMTKDSGRLPMSVVDRMKAVDAPEFDAVYLGASGVDGHQGLEATMKKVQSSADDGILKQLFRNLGTRQLYGE